MLQFSNFYTKCRRTNVNMNVEIPYIFQVKKIQIFLVYQYFLLCSQENAFMHTKIVFCQGMWAQYRLGIILTEISAYLSSLAPTETAVRLDFMGERI